MRKRSTSLVLLLLLAACEGPPDGVTARMDFASAGFWDTPFPGAHRARSDGTVDLEAFPTRDVPLVEAMVALLDGAEVGFGTTSGVFLPLTGAIDPAGLPALGAPDGAVFLVPVDAVPESGRRVPVDVAFVEDAGPFGARNTLALLPFQGAPLRPSTRYAAVITTALEDAAGDPLAPSPAMWALARGRAVEGLGDAARSDVDDALDAAEAIGVDRRSIVGLTVFRTGDPHAAQRALTDTARAWPLEPVDLAPREVFDDYCVYAARVEVPVFQAGEAPYLQGGGVIAWEGGEPVLDHHAEARLVLTIPRAPTPPAGWPVGVMIRTGGGGDRPLVDRGVRDANGAVAIPGSGPALHLARAGFAGISVDGPHGGLRNVTGGDEQFLMFNIGNPGALRDNLRQSAAELTLLPDLLRAWSPDIADCPGADAQVTFDPGHLALIGHSMGATIAPLVLGTAPDFGAMVLSGAGGSWIENVLHKQRPIAVRPIAEQLVGYDGRSLHAHDPVLSLLQWAGEAADPPVWNPSLVREPGGDAPRHVLMVQGIVDRYILPPIANATSVSLGLDLAGPAHDESVEEVAAHRTAASVLPLGGGGRIALPASGNRHDGAVTAVLVQYLEDGVEDGHEVFYQLQAPKDQLTCFLATWVSEGVPRVSDGSDCE